MKSLKNKVAVVTGAGAGIGRGLSLELSKRGASLAISDINEKGLAETEAMIRKAGGNVHSSSLDVADRNRVLQYVDSVKEHFGVIHQVYNNAGVASRSRSLLESEFEDIEKVLNVNLWGVINCTKAFLPHLIASGEGDVINISSLNGFMGQGNLTAYCTSKFGVRGFSESLRAEMKVLGLPVDVFVVHPGGVKTNISSAALDGIDLSEVTESERKKYEKRIRIYNEKLLKMPVHEAANIILDGVQQRRLRILIGKDAKWLDRIIRLMPEKYTDLIARWEKKTFKGAI